MCTEVRESASEGRGQRDAARRFEMSGVHNVSKYFPQIELETLTYISVPRRGSYYNAIPQTYPM